MCDLTTVVYQKDDIVWVKLGKFWWPGIVQDYDTLSDDVKGDFKKPPIAVVKFFEDGKFEYVKDHNSIYQYNCLKKNEFIKKGLAMASSTQVSSSNTQMFSSDVLTAEKLTNGDLNILKKLETEMIKEKEGGKAVYEILFSTPKKFKKQKKDENSIDRPLRDRNERRKTMPNKLRETPTRNITHPRFNPNYSDSVQHYQTKDLIQPSTTPVDEAKSFQCTNCDYKARRVSVIEFHYRSHARNYDHKIKLPPGEKRKKKSLPGGGASKKIKLTNGESSGKKQNKNERDLKKKSEEQQKEEAEKLKMNFLQDWDDEEKEDEEMMDISVDKSTVECKEGDKTSCFDFDENEDGKTSNNSIGFGKAVRHFSKFEEKTEAIGKTKESHPVKHRKESVGNEFADEIEALLNETKVPDIPELPNKHVGDSITLAPPSENISGFGSLNTDLNDSLDFRNEIKSRVSSTPAVSSLSNKLSKQTLKKNYFKKVREEIAEVAKFEEDDLEKRDEEEEEIDETEDVSSSVTKDTKETGDHSAKLLDNQQSTLENSRKQEVKVSTVNETVDNSSKPLNNQQLELRNVEQDVKLTNVAVIGKEINDIRQTSNTTAVHSKVTNELSIESNSSVSKLIDKKTPQKLPEKSELKESLKIDPKTTSIIKEPKSPLKSEPKQLVKSKGEQVISEPKQIVKIIPEKATSESKLENIIQIGNQNIHIPIIKRKSTEKIVQEKSKTESDKLENQKTEEDRLAQMMLVEEVQYPENESIGVPNLTSSVRINVSSNDKKIFLEKTSLVKKPTAVSVENTLVKPKYKTINIPSSSTHPGTNAVEEKYFILPNNQKIKAPPAKSPMKNSTPSKNTTSGKNTILLTPDGGKIYLTESQANEFTSKKKITIPNMTTASRFVSPGKEKVTRPSQAIKLPPSAGQSQIVYVSSQAQATSSSKLATVPLLQMKSTEKKISLPLPSLHKLPSKPKPKVEAPFGNVIKTSTVQKNVNHQNVLQNKIKSIAQSNASRSTASPSTSKDTIKVNQITLPSILQQRKNSNQPRGQPPQIISEPKIIEPLIQNEGNGSEIIASIAGIPDVDANDSIVYLIDNNQSQQILFNNVVDSNPSDIQTIFLDGATITIDGGYILDIAESGASAPQADILAQALADTQVLQAECAAGAGPINDNYQAPIVNNTFETSLTLNQAPIMSTSEAPSQVQNSAYYASSSSVLGGPLIEIKNDDQNVGLPSPEIGYAPSDIVPT